MQTQTLHTIPSLSNVVSNDFVRDLVEKHEKQVLDHLQTQLLPEELVFDYSSLKKDHQNAPHSLIRKTQTLFGRNYQPNELTNACSALKNNGLIVIKNSLAPEVVDLATQEMMAFIEERKKMFSSRKFYSKNKFIFDGNNTLKSYNKRASHKKCVINRRRGKDKGLIDFFNANYLFPTSFGPVVEILNSKLLRHILRRSLKARARFTNFNTYVNQGITSTRAFHIDTYNPKAKVFMYLTDVKKLDDGPYCYVLGSHLMTELKNTNRSINQLLGEKFTESHLVPPSQAFPIFGNKGDIIISFQHGFHRGHPQSENGKRILCVQSVDC